MAIKERKQLKLSQGVMNEFAYLGLAHTLLKSSELTEELKDDLPIDSYKPLIDDYHDNKRINRRLEKLIKQIEAVMKPALYPKSPFYPKVQGLGLELMSIAPQEVQGEVLALYILWYRFQPHERDKPLHEMFKPLSEKDGELFGVLELFEKHMSDDYIAKMEELARVIARLR